VARFQCLEVKSGSENGMLIDTFSSDLLAIMRHYRNYPRSKRHTLEDEQKDRTNS